MARSVKKSAEATKPTHELLLKVELANGTHRVLGRVGLFTDNNNLHAQVADMDSTRITKLLSKLSAEVIEYGEYNSSDAVDLGF